MTFPLPFQMGSLLPTVSPAVDVFDSKHTVIIPDSLLLPTSDKPRKLTEAEIDAALAALRPAPIKKARKPDPDPPGKKYPYVTQFCSNGGHEGQVALSFRGTRMKSCSGIYDIYPQKVVCTCWCHKSLAIKTASGVAAPFIVPIGMPETGAPVTMDARPVETAPVSVVEPDVGYDPNESPFERLLRNVAMPLGPRVRNLVLKYLGREVTPEMMNEPYVLRRRGELDSNVEAICRLWLAKAIPWEQLTTDVVSLLVDVDNPPSPGAVHAVFTRWDDSNFAIIQKNPVRFECFTPTVQEIGIEAARNLAHRRARASERGFKL